MRTDPAKGYAVFTANSDGTGVTQLTGDQYDNIAPSFSPDGKKIVFTLDSGTGTYQIVVMNADGTAQQVLPLFDTVSAMNSPMFSPDGSKIVAEAKGLDNGSDSYTGLAVMNVDGSNAKMFDKAYTDICDCEDQHPTFTPDGSKIVFNRDHSASGAQRFDIYIMNSDGTNVMQLTDQTGGVNFDPLAVGNRILFSSNRDYPGSPTTDYDATKGYFEVYSMKTDGTDVKRLTSNMLFDGFCRGY